MRTYPDQRKIRLFYCYSHVDEELRNSLANHLSALQRAGVIDEWHDRRITAGSEWKALIDRSLDEADVVLLLISADFLASDYCYDAEMQRALQRHEAKEAVVIPVILRPVDWSDAPFGKLQTLPKDARPVTSWADRDEAFTAVAKGIRSAISGFAAARGTTADSSCDSSGEQYETEEEGLLDLVELGNREFKLLTEVATRMADAIAELGHKANATTGRLEPDQQGKVDPARAKPIVDLMARYMSDFARDLASQVQEFAEARERGLQAVRRASELAPDFEEGGVRGLRSNNEQLDILRASIPKTRGQMESLRNTIARLPRLTTKLNRAKKLAVRSLDALQEQLDLAMKDTDSVKGRIAEVLRSMTSKPPASTLEAPRRNDSRDEVAHLLLAAHSDKNSSRAAAQQFIAHASGDPEVRDEAAAQLIRALRDEQEATSDLVGGLVAALESQSDTVFDYLVIDVFAKCFRKLSEPVRKRLSGVVLEQGTLSSRSSWGCHWPALDFASDFHDDCDPGPLQKLLHRCAHDSFHETKLRAAGTYGMVMSSLPDKKQARSDLEMLSQHPKKEVRNAATGAMMLMSSEGMHA